MQGSQVGRHIPRMGRRCTKATTSHNCASSSLNCHAGMQLILMNQAMVGTVMRLHPRSKRSKYSDRQVAGRAVALGVVVVLISIGSAGCDAKPTADRPPVGTRQAADPVLGQRLQMQYQCGNCHAIAGQGIQGPSLQAFGKRSYIAGRIPNNPAAESWRRRRSCRTLPS